MSAPIPPEIAGPIGACSRSPWIGNWTEINFPKAGQYTFFTGSDDGSQLLIDEILEVKFQGPGIPKMLIPSEVLFMGPEPKPGLKNPMAGTHPAPGATFAPAKQ